MRGPAHRSERLAAPRRAAPGGRDVLDRRPRLDERDRGERQAREACEACGRRHDHARLDRRPLQEGGGRGIVGSTSVETTLLILKVAFLVLLYLFIWRIVRAAGRDLRLPQDTIMLAPGSGGVGLTVTAPHVARLVVERSPSLDRGLDFQLDSAAVMIGRSSQNDIALDGDEFASARH